MVTFWSIGLDWIIEQDWQAKELSNTLGKGLKAPVVRLADAGTAECVNTSLSMLNWAAAQGAEQTTEAIKALLKRLKNNEPLPEVLTALLGEQTTEHLLGCIPMVSDIAVHVDEKQQMQIKAQRWQWYNNGWQLIEQPMEILQLVGKNTQLYDLQKSSEINTTQDFIILDSWTNVERTPKNNVWRKTAKP